VTTGLFPKRRKLPGRIADMLLCFTHLINLWGSGKCSQLHAFIQPDTVIITFKPGENSGQSMQHFRSCSSPLRAPNTNWLMPVSGQRLQSFPVGRLDSVENYRCKRAS